MASITTQVSQSIYDTVNSTTSEETSESKIPTSSSAFGLDGILSESTKIVRDIGKKTINLLQENDPLANLNASNKPNLSQILKEAAEQNDSVAESENEAKLEVLKLEQLLDDYQGFMSLEALEILSNQSKLKIELLLKSLCHDKKATDELEETLDEVKELCDFDNDGDFDEIDESKLFEDVDTLDTKVDFTETRKIVDEMKNEISKLKNESSPIIYENTKKILAKVCSQALHNLHKFAESLLNKSHRSTANEAESLLQIAAIYCSIFNLIATNYTEIIEKNSDENKKIVTNIFLEVSFSFI